MAKNKTKPSDRESNKGSGPSTKLIPDAIHAMLDFGEEDEDSCIRLANEEGAVLVCAIAPYTAVRVSPIESVSASLGLHEEFAIEALVDKIQESNLSNAKLMLLLNTPGGGLHSAFKVARALRKAFKTIEVYVPHLAASGGTLIALTGDSIIMGPMSQLSPLDPQVVYNGRQISALCMRNAFNRLCKLFERKTKDEAPYPHQALVGKLDPLLMEVDHQALGAAQRYVSEILNLAGYGEKTSDITGRLIYGFPEHDSDIDAEMAESVGLRVKSHDKDAQTKRIWRVMRNWLGKYMGTESGVHIIRYVLPTGSSGRNRK